MTRRKLVASRRSRGCCCDSGDNDGGPAPATVYFDDQVDLAVGGHEDSMQEQG
jgi:hypothetical protein